MRIDFIGHDNYVDNKLRKFWCMYTLTRLQSIDPKMLQTFDEGMLAAGLWADDFCCCSVCVCVRACVRA